ncbi:MAG: MFS transporter [Gemmatimonadaceae bacterium]
MNPNRVRVQSGRIAEFLALERNVVAVAGAMFLLSFGEELWKRFMPKFLEVLGAPVLAIGLYGTTRDLLDGLYQYPGGWIADHYGRRRALVLFVALATVGYAIYSLAPSWPFVFVGLIFVMAWTSMASPALFAVVGDALPKEQRAMGFTVQSILRRVPIIVAPALGGLTIAAVGVQQGMRAGLVTTIALAVVTLVLVARVNIPLAVQHGPTDITGVWRALPATFHRLLASDIFIRTSEGLVDVFLVLYATNVVGVSAAQFGVLIGVQMATSILVYIPAARIADRSGRKPFVIATFLAFSLFPVAVIAARSFGALVLAFVVGGLREIGEPARKALIVDLAQPHLRARSVGLYYLIRSVAIAPAAFIGGLLWKVSPTLPFSAAAAVGLAGTAVFALTVHERNAA